MFDRNLPEIQFALHAVRQASLLVRQIQAEMVSPALTKGDCSPVTVADFASQAVVGHLLAQTFPKDVLVAEEDSTVLRQAGSTQTLDQVTQFVARFAPQASPQAVCDWIDHARVDSAERFWTLDPIDGTKGFLRGDQYVTALALLVRGQVQIGVLGCPNLVSASQPRIGGEGSLVIAARGQGTWTTSLENSSQQLSFERLQASGQTDPMGARVMRSFEAGHTDASKIDAFTHLLGVQAAPVLMDSQAKYAVLAAGGGELLLRLLSPNKPDYREKIWDHAAGSLALEEAGGRITDLAGKALDFTTGRELKNNRGMLASNGRLHAAALKALHALGA
jgi:3'(2'), 5'-bisphosphate nucleotidase